MTKKISVIIPVYNGAPYLERCFNSIINQKDFAFDDLEVITINDGSKDDSLEILKKYETTYPTCFMVVDQPNQGIAKTRNAGIALATGTYLMFIDQDDWIDEDYCATFYRTIEESGADVVYGGYRRPGPDGKSGRPQVPSGHEYSKYIIVAAWAKIHRTRVVKANNIAFFANKFGEDSVFTVREIKYCPRWVAIPYVGYNWYNNERSTSNTSQKALSPEDVRALIRLLDNLKEDGGAAEERFIQYYLVRTVVFYLLFSGRSATRTRFLEAYKALFNWLAQNVDGFPRDAYYIVGPRGEKLAARCAIATLVILHRLRLVSFAARFIVR